MTKHQKVILLHLKNVLIKLSNRQYLYAALFWTCLTLYLSLISARAVTSFNIWDFTGFDKLAHFMFYAVFSFLWSMATRGQSYEKKIVLIFAVSFGIFMEICQFYLFNGRSFEFYDILANISGAFTGVILFKIFIN